MFFFRINKLRIIDNRERRRLLRVFQSDGAEVKLNSFITTDETQLPDMDELLATNDPARKRDLLSSTISHIVDSRVLTTIENIADNHEMTFGDTGYVLYRSQRIPEYFDWLFLAIESDRDVREMGRDLSALVQDRRFDDVILQVLKYAASAVNPTAVAAVEISKLVAKTIANQMAQNRDDMIGILYTSLNRQEHYRHGERKRDHVPDLTNNMFIDYSLFGMDALTESRVPERLPPVARASDLRRESRRRRRA